MLGIEVNASICSTIKENQRYKDMKPDKNQPAYLYGTDKAHKFESLEDITVANPKF